MLLTKSLDTLHNRKLLKYVRLLNTLGTVISKVQLRYLDSITLSEFIKSTFYCSSVRYAPRAYNRTLGEFSTLMIDCYH